MVEKIIIEAIKSAAYVGSAFALVWGVVKIFQEQNKSKREDRAGEKKEMAKDINLDILAKENLELKNKVSQLHKDVDELKDDIEQKMGDKLGSFDMKFSRVHSRIDELYKELLSFSKDITKIIQG